ncbi:MAG TPA: thiamine pyrophosphate-binding protein [Blastocatellia bacterium]|nr:thiamine pyrophosphate-binding protein [Blastocatellia bacterium]
MNLHGGQLVARTLKAAGVDVIFTLCGGHIMPIYDGCLDEGIRIIDVRHEQAAVHAADAWARCTGRPGVAVITAGPGVTDGVTGVANAYRANSPILVIGGQGPFFQFGQGSLQEMDHVALMKPITKWAGQVLQTERIPELIEVALRHALAGIPGPVFLEIPIDLLMNQVSEKRVYWPRLNFERQGLRPSMTLIDRAADLLCQARRPVLIAGSSVKWADAHRELNRFIDALHLPTYTNGMGRGTVPPDSPNFFAHSRRAALQQADVLVLAGAILDFRLNFGRDLHPEVKIIQMDLDRAVIGQNRSADVGLVGDLGAIFEALREAMVARCPEHRFTAWRDELREIELAALRKMEPRLYSSEVPIDPLRLCREIADFVDDETIVIGDGGDIVSLASKVIPVRWPGQWMDPGPLGCLGIGMPFALAAQLAHPEKKVLVIFGDGSFGFNGFEFDTAVRFNLPIMSVVGNDAAWGQMRRPQIALYGNERAVATKLAPTRYDRVVEALGGYGEWVERPEEIAPALRRMAASGKPACVNVRIAEQPPSLGEKYF